MPAPTEAPVREETPGADEVITPDHGQRFHESAGDSTLGRLVTAAYQHPRFGIVQVWVSGGPQGTVMATYTMSLEDTVAQELIDAQAIVESADLAGPHAVSHATPAPPA